MYPGAAEYVSWMIGDYGEKDPSFPGRWQQLRDDLAAIAVEAKRASYLQPMLVILPIMCEFREYPLKPVHSELTKLGRGFGLEVIDMLPVFAKAFPDGRLYLAGPDDNHFNAEVHAKVAEVLRAAMAEGKLETQQDGRQPR